MKIVNSIKLKIVSLLFAAIAIVFILCFVIFLFSNKIMTESIAKNNIVLSSELIDKIDLNIEKFSSDIRDLLYNNNILKVVKISNLNYLNSPDIEITIKEKSESWQNNDEISNELLKTTTSLLLKRTFFEKVIKEYGYPIFGEIILTNKFGETISTINHNSYYMQNNELWWQEAVKNGVYFSDIKYDESAGVFGMDIAYALIDENEVIGIVKGVLDINKLIEEARISWGSKSNLEVFIFTNNGNIIYASHIYKFMEDYSKKQSFPKNMTDQNGYNISKKDGYLYSYNISRGYRTFPGLGWVLTIGERLDRALEPLNRFRNIIFLLIIVMLLIGVTVTLFIIKSIITPLNDFKNGALEIADGNLNYAFKKQKNEELRVLSKTFNTMVKKLKTSYHHLEKKEQEAVTLSKDLVLINKELEQFAYIASHDLKEPLRKVIAYGGILSEDYSDDLDEEAQRYISVMTKAAERMNNLLTNLLAFSRIDRRGKEFVLTSLNDILADVIFDLEIQIHETNAEIVYDDLPDLLCDRIQIAQVFQNMISNSIKFVQSGNIPKIHISYNSDDSEFFTLRVKDNGIGFDIQYKDEIFKPFRKLHSTSEYSGTGIGLAICKKIVKRHLGGLDVNSKLGHGTTFYITFRKEI